MTYGTCLQSKYRLYEIRPSTQASYTIGSGTTMQENQVRKNFKEIYSIGTLIYIAQNATISDQNAKKIAGGRASAAEALSLTQLRSL